MNDFAPLLRRSAGNPDQGGARSGVGGRPNGLVLAQIACIVGLVFAAASFYWALGGTWLLSTVSASLAEKSRTGEANLLLGAWVPGGLKVLAALVPLLALHRLTKSSWDRALWALASLEAGILTLYGMVLTTAGWLVQADLLHASADADHRALAWHAYLWDPWFLIWGLLVTAALLRSRHLRSQPTTGRGPDGPPAVRGATDVPLLPAPS